MYRLRCHNFELTKPASWGWPKTSLSAREVLGSISGPVSAVSSVVKRTNYRCGRFGAWFPGRSNRHSVANSSPLLRRFCVSQLLSRGHDPQWRMRGRGAGSQPLPWRMQKNEIFFNFETNRLFFVQSLPKLLSCFFCSVQLFNLISRNFHYDASDAINSNTGSPTLLMCFAWTAFLSLMLLLWSS